MHNFNFLGVVALAKSHHRRARTYGGRLCSAKVRFEQAGPDAFGFAGEELAAWLQSETAQNRALRDQQPPKKYWLAPEPGAHDPRGTASWLADTHYIPTYGDQQLERELREKQ